MFNLARGLARRDVIVHFIVPDASAMDVRPFGEGVRVIDLGARRRGVQRVIRLARYLRQRRPDVLLTTKTAGNVVGLLAATLSGTGTPVVVREANTPSRRRGRTVRENTLARYGPSLYRMASAVVAISEGVADDLRVRCGVPAEKIRVIYNPVVTPDVQVQAAAPCEHDWLRTAGPPVVLTAARLEPPKDVATLIRAFAELQRERPIRLVILGQGPDRPALEELAGTLGVAESVSFAGFTPNPFAYMSRASVFVLSSLCEGFGNVLVEAMACGLTPVASDCPSGPREILDDGRYGRLVPPGEPGALAAGIAAALDLPVEPNRLRARALEFSDDRAVTEYLSLLLQGAGK